MSVRNDLAYRLFSTTSKSKFALTILSISAKRVVTRQSSILPNRFKDMPVKYFVRGRSRISHELYASFSSANIENYSDDPLSTRFTSHSILINLTMAGKE